MAFCVDQPIRGSEIILESDVCGFLGFTHEREWRSSIDKHKLER